MCHLTGNWTPDPMYVGCILQPKSYCNSLYCCLVRALYAWFCFRSVLNSADYFANCQNNASLQKALEAYSEFLSKTVPGAEESCHNPCQFSLVRPKTYSTIPFVANLCLSITPIIYSVTLRMPTTIILTETTVSYPFMTFAAELGGNTKIDCVSCLFFIYKRYLLNLFE